MSTITRIPGGVCAAQGFTANGIHCGIRKNKTKHDLSVIYSDVKAAAACVYTTNRVKGAPLTVTKNHNADGYAQAVICNSGNANTCNANGIEIAEQMSDLLGEALHISPADILELYHKAYDGSPLVRVANSDESGFLSAGSMTGKDSMEISVYGNPDRMILVARYDNLGKGASGAAVECLNILLGADPTANLVV